MADPGQWALAVAAALAGGASLVLRGERARVAAMALALALAAATVAAEAWDDPRLRDLRDSPALAAAALATAAIAVGALAVLIRRLPAALPVLAVAALPFRIPIEAGGDSANLLLPLYAVIAAGVVAEIARPPSGAPAGGEAAPARWLPWALAGFVLLYAVQSVHSDDFAQAAENVGFFLVPFAVLAALLRRAAWTPGVLRAALAVIVAEALVFAAIGFAEFGLRELLWNPAIVEANEIHAHFRVNSLFWDPNIFGRYLAVVIVAVAAVMIWRRAPRTAAGAGAIAFVLLAALATTYSQSSLIALLAGLAVLAGLRWSARWVTAACAVAALAVLVALAAGGAFDTDASSRKSIDIDTSGRWELIEGGLEMAADDPVAGLGSGGFERAFQERFRAGEEAAGTVSHTEPVTVLAEQGAIGLLAYLAVVAIAFAALGAGIRPYAPGLAGGGGALAAPAGLDRGIARATLVAALAAMFVHSLSYAAFFTDPITWALLAIALSLGSGSDPQPKDGLRG